MILWNAISRPTYPACDTVHIIASWLNLTNSFFYGLDTDRPQHLEEKFGIVIQVTRLPL